MPNYLEPIAFSVRYNAFDAVRKNWRYIMHKYLKAARSNEAINPSDYLELRLMGVSKAPVNTVLCACLKPLEVLAQLDG